MKNIIINSLIALGTIGAFSSCKKTDGALYSGEPNKISFLTVSTKMNMVDGTLNIPVGRTSTDVEGSFDLTLKATGVGYSDVFKLDGPVLFAKGEGKSYAKVKYTDFSIIDPSTLSIASKGTDVNVTVAFPFSLNIAAADASPSQVVKTDIVASTALTFKEVGNAVVNSTKGWNENTTDVKIQKANGANIYKLVTPYGPYSIVFAIKADGKTVNCPDQVIAKNAKGDAVSITGVVGTYKDGAVTLAVKAYKGAIGDAKSGVEVIKLP